MAIDIVARAMAAHADSKAISAYQYAVEGGYTGTEEEFRAEVALMAENAQAVNNAVRFDIAQSKTSEQKTQAWANIGIDSVMELDEETETTNIEQEVTERNSGYYWEGHAQPSSSYFYVHLTNLLPNDVIYTTQNNNPQSIRFVDAYSGTTRISSACRNTQAQEYTVPNGIDNVYITCYTTYQETQKFYVRRSITRAITKVKGLDEINNKIAILYAPNSIMGEAESLASGTDLILSRNIDNKKNCSYIYWANFATFTRVTIGHGWNVFGASHITVDNTNITAYYYNGSQVVVMGTYPHGLTISDFIQINIKVADIDTVRATVSVMTSTGSFTQTDVPFGGCNGSIFATGQQASTDVKFQYVMNDMDNDVYIFGDSYTSLGDPNRYLYQLMEQGYSAYLISGYSGATSNAEILSFRNIMDIHTPKFVVWTLGMNDGDSGTTYNANWKTCLDEVIETCKAKGSEVILATIPNVPNVSNYYKNEYVRESGYRYVDFAKAVGAEEIGSMWYPNMLSSDNVHPAVLGAKALASRILVDVPEIVK